MTQSNIQLKSNVYLRKPGKRVIDDLPFLRQVRGLKPILKVLDWFGIPKSLQRYDNTLVIRLEQQKKLTPVQRNLLLTGLRCVKCDCIPSGTAFNGWLEFRCRLPGCPAASQTRKK